MADQGEGPGMLFEILTECHCYHELLITDEDYLLYHSYIV